MRFGNLLVELPLFIALWIVVRHGVKTLKVTPFGPDQKADMKAVVKALVYIFVAGILLWFFTPPFGVVSTIFGLLITIILSILIILAAGLHSLPTTVDDLAWRDGWNDPWNRSGDPTPLVRWARRFAMLLFVLFVFVVALVGGGAHGQSSANADGKAAAPASSAPQPSASAPAASAPAPTTSAPAPSNSASVAPPAQEYIQNSCHTQDGKGGPQQIATVHGPSTIIFGATRMQLCYSGRWRKWSDITSLAPPKSVRLLAWEIDGSYGYGQIVDPRTGDSYLLRTSEF